MKVQNFESWSSSQTEEVNELFGLGKLFKSLFASFSEPLRKKVDLISKNVDSKTGKVRDAKELSNDLVNTFKIIADDKKADLKGGMQKEEIIKIVKEFITEVKAVFSASRVPFAAMVESLDAEEAEALMEDIKQDFHLVMTTDDEKEYEKYLDMWLDDWVKQSGDDPKTLEKAAVKLIDTMITTFKKKVENFGPERLKKLIAMTEKNPDPKKEDIKKVLDEKPAEKGEGEEVETEQGKEQFLAAIKKDLDTLDVEKIKHDDGSFDVVFKGVKL